MQNKSFLLEIFYDGHSVSDSMCSFKIFVKLYKYCYLIKKKYILIYIY